MPEKKKRKPPVTHHLKNLLSFLLEGCFIMEVRSATGAPKFKCYRGNMDPVMWLTRCTHREIKDFLRWEDKKKTRQVIDIRKVRGLTLHHTFKIMYREHMKKVYAQNLKGLKDK